MSKIPLDAIATLHAEGKSPREIVNAIYAASHVALSIPNVQKIIEGLELQQKQASIELPPPPPLMEFVPQVSRHKRYESPQHLAPLVDLIEQIGKRPVRAVVHAPPRHGKCQPAGSPVLLVDGRQVPIEEVNQGDRVVTLLPGHRLGEAIVTGGYQNGCKPVLRLHLYSGRSIDCTENHPLLTINGWREAGHLYEEDSVATARRLPCPDGEPMPYGFAALMGYIVGDGSFGSGKPIITTKDSAVLEHLGKIANAYEWKLTKDGDCTYHVRRKKSRRMRAGDSATEQLRAWGLKPGTSHTKRFPECIYTASRDDIREFLAAYFNCDGTVNHRREGVAEFASVNRNLLRDTQELLCRFGIFSTLRAATTTYKGSRRGYFRLIVSGGDLVSMADALPVVGTKGEQLRKVADRCRARRHFPEFESIPGDWRTLLRGTTPHFLRKHHGLRVDKKYTRGTARMLVQKAAAIDENDTLRDLCSPDIAWERIVKIEKLGEVETFGISVANTQNYISGGVISHNTDTVLHAIAYHLRKRPELVFGFAAYEQHIAFSKSIDCQDITKRAGIKLRRDAAREWRTYQGGGLLATSVGGPLTGYGITGALFIDDAYKNRVQAESKVIRNAIWEWFLSVAMSRIEPGGSVFISMTRWHPDDLAGRALREKGKHRYNSEGQRLCQEGCPGCGPIPDGGFEEYRLPALNDEGVPLWGSRWTVSELERRRREVGEYTWWSLYQGVPRARGSSVFSGLTFYDPSRMPIGGFKLAIGIDLSYTESTSADWAVAVVVMLFGSEYWVLEVVREQTTAPKFAQKLKALRKRWKRAPMYSIYYGAEKGSIDFMRTIGVPITGLKRGGDKFIRAQPTAAKWNEEKILVPMTSRLEDHELTDGKRTCAEDCPGCGMGLVDYNHLLKGGVRMCANDCTGCRYPWLDPFIEVVTQFTGVKDDCDDDVDALVAAIEGMGQSPAVMLEKVAAMAQTGSGIHVPGAEIPERERRRSDDGDSILGDMYKI